MSTIIELDDAWKIYEMGETDVEALRGLSLTVERGEYMALMGPSGSGKSTAMNMIGCLDTPTRGEIYLDGTDIATLEESDLAQIRGKKIGFVFQKFNLIQTLDALENVTLPMLFQGTPHDEREQRGSELLDKVGLGDRLHHTPSELSGGQQQRVAIARSLANEPEVILADEPTGNLDTETGAVVLDLLEELHEEEGVTIVSVTHDPNVAERAERTEHLKDGKLEGTA